MTKVDIYEDVSIIEVTSGGIQGPKGDKGDGAATVTVGTTTTGSAGTNASVTNSGTVNDVVLNFTIPQGIKGDQGDPGTPGTNGTNGINGTNGLDGADGDSAYQVAVNNGFVGTEQQWLESLVGETGAQGAPGDPGLPGTNGTNGVDGADGAPGVGVIPGGTAGQVLTKIDSTDYNTQWSTIDLSTKQDVVSGVSSTEIGYLDGVTSSIQTQLNAKQATINPGTGLAFNTYGGIPYLEVDSTSNINITGLTVSGSVNFTGASITGLPSTPSATATTLGTVYGKTMSNVPFTNTTLGYNALPNPTISGGSGVNNIAIGAESLFSHTTGNSNIAIGPNAMYSNTTGTGNTAVGRDALSLNTTGQWNIAIGQNSGNSLTTGINNIIVGYNSSASSATVSNEITLGNANISRFRMPGMEIDWQHVISEETTIFASAPTATTHHDVMTSRNISFYTSNTTNNWVLNIRGNSGTTYESISSTNKSTTFVFMATNNATAYYPTSLTIDGTAQTVKWQGGTAPSAGNTNSIDVYTYVVIKTAANTYTVLGSQTKFA